MLMHSGTDTGCQSNGTAGSASRQAQCLSASANLPLYGAAHIRRHTAACGLKLLMALISSHIACRIFFLLFKRMRLNETNPVRSLSTTGHCLEGGDVDAL